MLRRDGRELLQRSRTFGQTTAEPEVLETWRLEGGGVLGWVFSVGLDVCPRSGIQVAVSVGRPRIVIGKT